MLKLKLNKLFREFWQILRDSKFKNILNYNDKIAEIKIKKNYFVNFWQKNLRDSKFKQHIKNCKRAQIAAIKLWLFYRSTAFSSCEDNSCFNFTKKVLPNKRYQWKKSSVNNSIILLV